MLAVAVDAITMDTRGRNAPGGVVTSPETARAAALFNQFLTAGTFKSVLFTYRQLCEVLRLKPTNINAFYPQLKTKLHSWKAASLWAKLDKRASHKCYNRGKACPNTRVLIIGAGPCGLRAAIEAQLLGAKVVVIEKRDRFSRNNVLHLWPFVIHDLRSLGAKKFFGKFCAGSIDHISIRQLQLVLLKVALLLGIEVHENVGFAGLVEPLEDQMNERIGWCANVLPPDHPVSQYEFDVLVGADGKRNTLLGFNRKEFRGKLAIAVTANFINRHTLEEARVHEISGVAFIFNQKFFQDMREQTGIDLENIVYYKDDTHYFVMTAKKQSLLDRGVIINDYNDTARLLAAENVDREALMEYARDAADFATSYQLPNLDFAVNHYGQADVAMFDFTSMYAAENACRIVERRGHRLLQGLVGDSLLEPFWPTGSGCARGFLSSFDVGWMIRSWSSGKMTQLQVLAERESIYRLLAQTTPENLSKDMNQYTLNPSSRYPNLNIHAVLPSQVRSLYDTDGNIEDQIIDVAIEAPKKKRRRESIIHPDTLLNWCKKQVALHDDVKIENLTSSWKNGLAFCAILHRYRPDLIDLSTLQPENIAKNNQLAFDICERELGIPPVMTGQEMADCDVPDKLSMVSYISQIYECFRGEIPVVSSKTTAADEQSVSPSKHGTPLSLLTKLGHKFQNKRKYSIEREANKERIDNVQKRSRNSSTLLNKRRSKERDKGIALDLVSKDVILTDFKALPSTAPKQSINSRLKILEEKMKRDAGLRCHLSNEVENSKGSVPCNRLEHTELSIKHIQEQLQKNGNETSAKKISGLKVGKLRKDEWNVKMLEEKIKQQQKSLQKSSGVEKSKILKNIFDDKLRLIDAKLKAGGTLTAEEQARFQKFDSSLNKLQQQLTKGNLEAGERGHNQVAAMTEHMASIWDKKAICKKDPLPPPPVVGSTSCIESPQTGGSEICYFCKKRVYLMERLSTEGLFFHRICFKCEYCGASLRLGNYSFDRDAVCGGKFYCRPHFRMQKPDHRWQEMMKRKQAFLSCTFDQQEKEKIYTTILANAEKALSPNKPLSAEALTVTDSPKNQMVIEKKNIFSTQLETKALNLLSEPIVSTSGRDQTPERVEYENSILELSEEELLTSELEEEELTQKNLGPCQDLATSDDEFSDLSTDTESDEEAFAEELERSLTADETRKLAQTWQRRYSAEHSLIDSGASSSADDESSDTEIGSDDGTGEDVDSDAEYSLENTAEGISVLNDKPLKENQILKSSETKADLMVEVPVIDLKGLKHNFEEELETDSDLSDEESESNGFSEEGSVTEVDTESEPDAMLPPPLIPTIVIEESPPQDVDQEQDWEEINEKTDQANTGLIHNSGNILCDDKILNDDSFKPLDSQVSLSKGTKNVSLETHIMPSNSAVKLSEKILDSEIHNFIGDVECIPSRPLTASFHAICDVDSISLPASEVGESDTFPFEKNGRNVAEDNADMKQNVSQHSAFKTKFLCSQDLCEIDCTAKEIVCDVLKTAQKSISSIIDSLSVADFGAIPSGKHIESAICDQSPCTENSSSTTESVGWMELKSSHSSGDSEVPLIQELISPTVFENGLICQDLPKEQTEAKNDHLLCKLNQTIAISRSSLQESFNPDFTMFPIHSSSSPENVNVVQIPDNLMKNDSVLFNKKTEDTNNDNVLGLQQLVSVNKCETDQIVTNCSLNAVSPIDGNVVVNNSYDFNPSFVTIRKKTPSHNNYSFHWDSDNSISPPFFVEEANDSVSVDIQENVSVLIEGGVYRATLVQSVDGDYFSEEENACGSNVVALKNVTDDLDFSQKLKIDENEYIFNENDMPVSSVFPLMQPSEIHDTKTMKIMPVSTLLPGIDSSIDESRELSTIDSSGHNINLQIPPKNQGLEISSPIPNTNNFYATSFSDSKLLSLRPLTGKISVEGHPSSNTEACVLSRSVEFPNDKTELLERKRSKPKYHGYSGSFAEKVRPKSLFGDTIYLRSLDINLQRQQFPSLAKSTDKLVESDSYSESNEYCLENDYCDVRRKLSFDSEEKPNFVNRDVLCMGDCFVESRSFYPSSTCQPISKVSPSSMLPILTLLPSKPETAVLTAGSQENTSRVSPERHRHSSAKTTVSFVTQEVHSDPISPYTYAQTRSTVENVFPVKMQPKGELDIAKLRQKREKRKSVHEDIQGLLFADDEKQISPSEPLPPSEDVFDTAGDSTTAVNKQQFPMPNNKSEYPSRSHTPEIKDQDEYVRLQRTVDQEKAREEARARARLKSDEELGLSPNNYRKKYRQPSLNSIHYEELYQDEFLDHDDEELEDEIIDETVQAKSIQIIESDEVIPDSYESLLIKPSPLSLAENSHLNVDKSQEFNAHNLNKIIPVDISESISKTNASNCLESPLYAAGEEISAFPPKIDFPCSSSQLHHTSSSETSPDIYGNEPPQFDVNVKNKSGMKQSQRNESSGDEDKIKSSGKKSFFSILNFSKNASSKEKLSKLPLSKDMDKERSSSLPGDLSGKTHLKHKPFSHLKHLKPKEKSQNKLSNKSILPEGKDSLLSGEQSPIVTQITPLPGGPLRPKTVLPNLSHLKTVPKYMIYRTPKARSSIYPPALPIQKVENGLAPKASEDSFSDTEDDTQGSRGPSGISTLEKRDKSSAEKERKAQRMVMKVQRQQELKRLRTAQEIQRRLEELEIQQKELEQQGVEVEKALRGEAQGLHTVKSESELMQEWYSLVRSKHRLRKEEQELSIRMKDLELEDRHCRLQQEMRIRMAQNGTLKNPSQIGEERKILSEMLRIVEERDELVAMLEQLRVREEEEDKNLVSQIPAKGVSILTDKT